MTSILLCLEPISMVLILTKIFHNHNPSTFNWKFRVEKQLIPKKLVNKKKKDNKSISLPTKEKKKF
jgi:hypothetical protein